jgi:hypothetical protein
MDVKRRDVLKGAAAIIAPTPGYAQQLDAAKKWVDGEFQPSTLSKDQQMAEMEWFIKASAPFKGMEVNTVSEILSIHDYESKTLTKAFADITGINVNRCVTCPLLARGAASARSGRHPKGGRHADGGHFAKSRNLNDQRPRAG